MTVNRISLGLGTVSAKREVSAERKRRLQVVLGELSRRWKNWVVAGTAMTGFYPLIDSQWILDALVITLSVGFLADTLFPFRADIT